MFVMTHTSGLAIRLSLCISPKSLIPISRTAISQSSRICSTVSGSPTSLLKFPSVFRTRKPFDSTLATNSFVLVFPTLPVMPTTLMSSCLR